MSAFTVSTLTIDRCVSAMCRNGEDGKAETLLGQHMIRSEPPDIGSRVTPTATRHANDRSGDRPAPFVIRPRPPARFCSSWLWNAFATSAARGTFPRLPSTQRSTMP